MNRRRVARQGHHNTSQAAGHREARALAQSMKDAPVSELLVAGGFRAFTVEQMFQEGAA